MALSSLRHHVLRTTAGLVLAVSLPVGGSIAVAPFASASTPVVTTTAATAATTAATTVVPLTDAQRAAAAAAKAKAKAKAKKAAAKKRAAAKKARAKKRAAAKALRIKKRGKAIMRVAARYQGRPYVYGGVGPRVFDCSGYSRYVMRKAVNVELPRTAHQQAYSGKVKRVSRSERRVGDLVFFPMGGSVGHVGIYAGGGAMWAAPKPGDRIKKQNIWTGNVFYGRVR